MGQRVVLAQAVDDIHLVLHQCNEGRYHDGGTIHKQRGQLITQTLAATGRHQYKRVVACHQVADDCFLVAFKLVEAKIMLQCCI